jgi:hypothetical protein
MTPADIAYITENFASLAAICAGRPETPGDVRALMAAGRLPAPTYVLPDGTEMFPRDYFALVDEAGGLDALAAEFRRRYLAAGADTTPAGADEEWRGYLSGVYGVCLVRVSPETIYRKEKLVALLDAQLAAPRPDDAGWLADLRARVDELDSLERPFAPYDRIRFGGRVSRDRLITDVRARFPDVFG